VRAASCLPGNGTCFDQPHAFDAPGTAAVSAWIILPPP
jgi:hypothetical protein